MLYQFLDQNRTDLIERCQIKVATRPKPSSPDNDMTHGIPMFLGQLIDTLREEDKKQERAKAVPQDGTTQKPSPARSPTEVSATATLHGLELLQHGFTVNQVVHGYGDLCQSVTELAIEKNVKVSSDEFQILNLCLDNAIAAAVTEFSRHRESVVWEAGSRAMSEQLGFLAHELRNSLNTAVLSVAAIKLGHVGMNGATADVLDRSLISLRDLVDRAMAQVRLTSGMPVHPIEVELAGFIAHIQVASGLEAKVKGCLFNVAPVEHGVKIMADVQLLASALGNLLQNAFKFTHPHSEVFLRAYAQDDRVLIEVEDQCGGLPADKSKAIFNVFAQHHADRSGLGLGLSISQRAVEANGGMLQVRDMPGKGCMFTINLPRHDKPAKR